MDILLVFRAEIKRYFALRWSHVGSTTSWLLYALAMFVAIIVILNGVTKGKYGGESLVLIGWLTYVVASDCMSELPGAISEETKTGTLEQVCLTPVPLAVLMFIRSLVVLLGAGARGLMLVLILYLVTPVHFGPGLVPLFFISLFGAYGMGFLLAGLALVLKRISALMQLVFSLMIFATGAFVGLEKLGWLFDTLRLIFPLTWGISLMRSTALGEATLSSLWRSGQMAGLTLHSVIYLALGLATFAWGYSTARKQGTLGQY